MRISLNPIFSLAVMPLVTLVVALSLWGGFSAWERSWLGMSEGQELDQPGPSSNHGLPWPVSWPDGVSPQAAIATDSSLITIDGPLAIDGSGFYPYEPVALLLLVNQNLQPFIGGGSRAQTQANSLQKYVDWRSFLFHKPHKGGPGRMPAYIRRLYPGLVAHPLQALGYLGN